MTAMSTDDMPMCDECGAILDDDGTCPDAVDHDVVRADRLRQRQYLAERGEK